MESVVEDNSSASTENAAAEKNTEEKTATPPPQEAPKKSKKEDRLRKDDKNVEQFMKSLNSLPSVDEKFATVCKKYSQTADENKKLQFYIKQSDKRYALLLKEKEQLQHEFNKTILVKSKLENLCRELQKQNKAIKEESLLKIREEEERRKETQAKFQNTLSEITTLLHQNNEKNAKLRDDNINMTEKFKSVVQQYQLREQQVDKMAKQMSLEQQLADAKLQKASLEHQAERERLMAEMEQLKVSVAQYRTKIMELQGTETALRGQLGVYTDKYDEFQNALVKSNQVFGGFKEQMEMMSKKIKKLEKESLSWKKRWETSQTALLDMCGERQASEERAAAAQRQLQHMQSLCRTLQGERTVLLSTLKENNIERPPLPPPAPAPPPAPVHTPASNAKVDAMAANCVQLRQSLAHLQSQLNTLTNNKKQEEQQQPPKPEKQKKSKSKKNKQAQKVEERSESKEESDEPSAVKDTTEDEPNIDEATVSNEDNIEEKVDDETLENLIQAISSANLNLCDFEVVNDENGENKNVDKITEISGVASKQEEIDTNNETVNNEASLQLNDVKTENVVEKIKHEVDGKLNEVNANVEVDLNVTQEINSNDEISHIPEVKPISENGA